MSVSGAPTNVKAVSAINRASASEEVPADEAEALVNALEACNKGDVTSGLLPHVRQRGMVYLPVAIAGGANEAALAGKALLALVNTLACPDNTSDVLRNAAVDALCGIATRCKEKQVEVVREVTDVLLQVSLAGSGFPDALQKKAREYVTNTLVAACPRGVVAKMLHWLSDDREDDSATQISAERELAFQILESGALKKPNAITALQQDEAIPKIAARVLSAVSADQFQRLVPTVMQYLGASEASLSTVLDGIVGSKFDTSRAWEAMSMLSRHLPRASAFAAAAAGGAAAASTGTDAAVAKTAATFRCDTPLEKIAAVVSKKNALDNADVLSMLKAFAASAALASNDAAAKKIDLAKDILNKVMSHATLSNNFTAIEAAILAFASLVARDEVGAKANIDDVLAASLKKFVTETVTPGLQQYSFAFKKEGRDGSPRESQTVIACLENIQAVGSKLAEKQFLGALPPPSWVNVYRASKAKAGGGASAAQRAVMERTLEAAIRPRGN